MTDDIHDRDAQTHVVEWAMVEPRECDETETLSDAELRDICEALLHETAQALLHNDFARFEMCFSLPMSLETFQGSSLIGTRDELRATFDNVTQYYRDHDVTDLVRVCVAAAQIGPDEIHHTHHSMVMSRGVLVQKSFPTFSQLLRIDGQWRIGNSQYALADAPEHQDAIRGTYKPASAQQAQRR